MPDNKNSFRIQFVKYVWGVLTTFLTIVAAYQILSADRYAPYISAQLENCDDEKMPSEQNSHDLNVFLHGNIENTVYIDLLLYESCGGEQTITLSSISKADAELPNASVTVNFNRTEIDKAKLAFIGEPGADINAERIRGLYFLKGEIEGGHYELEALPVPFSAEMQRVFSCSKSMTNASDISNIKLAEAYLRTCIFEQPWDPWGWGNQN